MHKHWKTKKDQWICAVKAKQLTVLMCMHCMLLCQRLQCDSEVYSFPVHTYFITLSLFSLCLVSHCAVSSAQQLMNTSWWQPAILLFWCWLNLGTEYFTRQHKHTDDFLRQKKLQDSSLWRNWLLLLIVTFSFHETILKIVSLLVLIWEFIAPTIVEVVGHKNIFLPVVV